MMEQNQLIERIVAEVVARMGSPAGAKQPGARGSGAQPGAVQPGASSVAAVPALAPGDMAQYIDHTMLRPEAPTAAFDKLCQEALQYKFFSVCVNSCRVAYVARKLQGSGVKVCSVVGFPLGSMTSRSKAFETREAIEDGASEIDMVINVGLLKSGDYHGVEEDIRAVRRATRGNTILKVIIETALLTQDEKVMACELSKKAGADFVKTCTGFLGGGRQRGGPQPHAARRGPRHGGEGERRGAHVQDRPVVHRRGSQQAGMRVQRGHRDRGRGDRQLLMIVPSILSADFTRLGDGGPCRGESRRGLDPRGRDGWPFCPEPHHGTHDRGGRPQGD